MKDPLPTYRFLVTLDPADAYLPPQQSRLLPHVAAGAFQEARGLGSDLEVTAYPEGGINDFMHQLPVRHSWTNISLKRGFVRDPILWQWYEVGLRQSLGARRDGSIIMLDQRGRQVMAWEFRGGLAAKWTGPEFNAMESGVAIESLEIAHQGLTLAGVLDMSGVVDTLLDLFS
ncbi:MAG: phage tail protein [Pirellulaceae bacterium]